MSEITSFHYFSAVRFSRRPSLSFERFTTSSIVVGEHELAVELLSYLVSNYPVSTEHVVNGGDAFMAVSFVRAENAVVGGVPTQAVPPAVAPVDSDVTCLGASAWGGLGGWGLGCGKGGRGRGCGSIFVGAAIAAVFGGDFAFAFDVGWFEVCFEVAP